MILSGDEIKKQVSLKRIHLHPFLEEHINPNSYNYRLGPQLLEMTDDPIDPRVEGTHREIPIPESGCLLLPGRLYLGSTLEEIGSSHYVISLIGRSSIGRLGLFLQITSDLSQLGTQHCWTLELKVVQPLLVYPNMKIGQVTFWTVDGAPESYYRGKYNSDLLPHSSRIFREL